MRRAIHRTIGAYSHVLNVCTGEIMTFKETEEDIVYLLEHAQDENMEIDENVRQLCVSNGLVNTRLCRSHLSTLGLEFSFPTMVNLELNRRCTLRCRHCYIGKKNLSNPSPSIFGAGHNFTGVNARRAEADFGGWYSSISLEYNFTP